MVAAVLGGGESLSGSVLAVNARLVPTVAMLDQLRKLIDGGRSAVVLAGECIAAAYLKEPAERLTANGANGLLLAIRELELPTAAAELRLLEFPHDVIREHQRSLRDNLEFRLRDGYRQQSDGLFVAEGVTIGSHLVTDTTAGPILLDAGSSLGPFFYIERAGLRRSWGSFDRNGRVKRRSGNRCPR